MRGMIAYFGPLEAEQYLRPDGCAQLPSLPDREYQMMISSLDELQFVFCDAKDLLLTRYALPDAQVDYLKTAGFDFRRNNRDLTMPDEKVHVMDAYEEWIKKNGVSGISVFSYLPYLSSLCRRYDIPCDYPDFSVIRRINSKRYSTLLNHELGFSDPTLSLVVCRSDVLCDAGKQMLEKGAILVKDPWGVSGKGNILVKDEKTLNRICRFIEKQEACGLTNEWVVEHCFDKKIDFSCQFYIGQDGMLQMFGVRQVANNQFSYHGTCDMDDSWLSLLEKQHYMAHIEQIAERLYRDGYYGHVCIDSMITADDKIIPCVEINGRKSMSLIKYCLDKRLDFPHKSIFLFDNLVVPHDFRYELLLENLQKKGGLYQKGCQRGVLPMTSCAVIPHKQTEEKMHYRAKLYYALIGKDAEDALAVRKILNDTYGELSIGV